MVALAQQAEQLTRHPFHSLMCVQGAGVTCMLPDSRDQLGFIKAQNMKR